ncbi:MAG: Wzz/FepE/Etk N-terminal domain-containing protein, partial [Bacteroidota bacterium]|nr:Wzz/FepE/Etk N-terminal domain-containing protein [Bacteroidota bacterium]
MAINENQELEALIRNATAGAEMPAAVLPGNPSEADEDGEAGGFDLSTLVLVARRSLLWLLLLVALGVTASWLYLRYTKPLYQSTSLLKIDERAQADALGLTGQMAPVADKARGSKLAGEVELIKSGLIYKRLKDTLALDVNYYAQGTVLETELYGASPFRVRYVVKDPSLYNRKFNLKFLDTKRFSIEYNTVGRSVSGEYALGQPVSLPGIDLTVVATPQLTAAALEQDYHFTIQDESTVNGYLDRNLAVEIVNPDANTIQISFKDFNPSKAQSIVNKIDTVYLQEKLAHKKESAEASLRFLEQTLNETQNSLQRAEDNLQNFSQATKTSNAEVDMASITTKMEKMEEDRPKLEQKLSLLAEISRLASQASITNSETETVEQTLPGLAGIEDPQLGQALTELNNQQW